MRQLKTCPVFGTRHRIVFFVNVFFDDCAKKVLKKKSHSGKCVFNYFPFFQMVNCYSLETVCYFTQWGDIHTLYLIYTCLQIMVMIGVIQDLNQEVICCISGRIEKEIMTKPMYLCLKCPKIRHCLRSRRRFFRPIRSKFSRPVTAKGSLGEYGKKWPALMIRAKKPLVSLNKAGYEKILISGGG